jgi:hypothetical protein
MLSAQAIEIPVNGICQKRANQILSNKFLGRRDTIDKTSKYSPVA